MKKVIASLGVIALVTVLGVAVVFAYGSYKDLELKKEEAKLAENKIKEDDKKEISKKIDNNGKEESNNTTNYQTPVTNEDVSTKEVRTTEETQPKYTAEDAKNMSDDEFLDAYKEGMPSEDAEAVDELSKDSAYREYLRGQVEARANGQGGNY